MIISGTNLLVSNVYTVDFGNNNPAAFSVNANLTASADNSTITCTVPASDLPAPGTGTVDVRLDSEGGWSDLTPGDDFTYGQIPSISNLAASSGPIAYFIPDTIYGANLAGANAVGNFDDNGTNIPYGVYFCSAADLGYTAAATILSDQENQITCQVPENFYYGAVNVWVVTQYGVSQASAASQYTYFPTPIVTEIIGQSPVAGGAQVMIAGYQLASATAVDFGGIPAANFAYAGTSQGVDWIYATTPPSPAGAVDVTVENSYGWSAISQPADQMQYVGPPTITGISPSSGPLSGGTLVTLFGSGLYNGYSLASVTVGGQPAASSGNWMNRNEMWITVPAGAAGTVDIVATGFGGTSTTSAADKFTYVPPPSIAAVSPATGPVEGGTPVTISERQLEQRHGG